MKSALIFTALIAFAFALMPSPANAAQASLWPNGYWGTNPPIISCSPTGDSPSGEVTKKCTSLCNVFEVLQNVIYFVLTLFLFLAVPINVVWGGIEMMLYATNPKLFTQGKERIRRTVIGTAIVLSSFLIVNTFLWLLGNPGVVKENWPSISCVAAPETVQPIPASPQSTTCKGTGSFANTTIQCAPPKKCAVQKAPAADAGTPYCD